MRGVAAAVALVAVVIAMARWLRVSQREHYIAGACVTVARRWMRVRPENAVLAIVGVLAAVVGVAADGSTSAIAALTAALVGAVFPIPMTILGREVRLRWTRRTVTLAGVVLGITIVIVAAIVIGGAWSSGPAVAAVGMSLLVDLGAVITAPFERRAMGRHRDRAAAKLVRRSPTVIAITGSWGKTTTKNHIRDLLAGVVPVVASPASFNNTGGLARTINDHMGDDCEVLVAEMGMYGPGEIRALCSWIKPDIAVICAVGPMHLERAGSLAAIVAAKAEILERSSQAVLWVSMPELATLAASVSGQRVWRVGRDGTPDLDVEVRTGPEGIEVYARGEHLGTCPSGSNIHPENLGCAVAAVLAYGIDARLLGARIATLSNPDHRSTTARSERGVAVIDDTFNSNPAGAARALEVLVRAVPTGRRVVVTPGMVELGPAQFDANRDFATEIAAAGATMVVVGRTNRRALLAGAPDATTVCVGRRSEAAAWVRSELGEGDGVLWENDLPDHYP